MDRFSCRSKGSERRFHRDGLRLTIIVVVIFALLLMISVSLNDLLVDERAGVMRVVVDSIRNKRTNKVVNGSQDDDHAEMVSNQSANFSTNDEQNQTKTTTTESFMKRLPKAIIIGSRKSGTRALLKFLTANANIRAANKEVHFFDRLHNYKLGLDWYREQMPASWGHEITIEKSPAYFVTKEAPERIRSAMGAGIKLILIVRNPVTRLISDFSQLLAHRAHKSAAAAAVQLRDYDDYYHFILAGEAAPGADGGQASPLSDEAWAKAEAGFEDYVRRSDGGIDDQRRAIRAGMYSLHLERWLNLFGRRQIHLVDGERLISEPAAELRKVESFLGLEPAITSNDFVFNRTKGFFCLAVARNSSAEYSPPSSAVSSRRLKRREIVAATSIEQANSTVGPPPAQAPTTCLGEDKGRRHVRVRKELIRELQQFYAPFNEYLYSLMGRDFNWSRALD